VVAIAGLPSYLAYLPGLTCLAMVFVCGRMLFGGHHEPDRSDEVAELRAEVAQLRAEQAMPEREGAAQSPERSVP
jgi:hypothetical protein